MLDVIQVNIPANNMRVLDNNYKPYLGIPNVCFNRFGIYSIAGSYSIYDGNEPFILDQKPLPLKFFHIHKYIPNLNFVSDIGWRIELKNNTNTALERYSTISNSHFDGF